MAIPKDLAVYAPVQFAARPGLVYGHIARKERAHAVVVAKDGREYKVPWELLHAHGAGTPKRVTLQDEDGAASFRPGDEVAFRIRSRTLRGAVVRNGPKRALVDCDGEEYRVPYRLLSLIGARDRECGQQRLDACAALAESLISEHGLDGWSFQFDSAQKRAGACKYDTKVISLSRMYCIEVGDEQVRDTLLHEIAHALVGPKHNHDAKWKQVARSIGCTAERCHAVEFAPPKYIASCLRCGWYQKKNRRLRGGVCKKCRTSVTYRPFTQRAWEACSQSQALPAAGNL